MSEIDISPFFTLYEFSTGRRLFALQQVHERASARNLPDIVAHAEAAIAHDRGTRQLDTRWAGRGQQSSIVDSSVQPIDGLVDRTLPALRDGALTQAEVAKPGDGLAEQVDAFLQEVFPAGLHAVTSMAYVEELAAVDQIVEKLQGALAPTVTHLGLQRQATRLAELAVEYRSALKAPKLELTWATVRAARAQGQKLLLEAFALIIAETRGSTPESIAARADLLAPIVEQNEAIRRYLRSRRRVEDVDPDTGEVDPGAPPSGPVPEPSGEQA